MRAIAPAEFSVGASGVPAEANICVQDEMSVHTHAVRRVVEQLKSASLSSRKQAARRPTIVHAAAPRRHSTSDMRNRDVNDPERRAETHSRAADGVDSRLGSVPTLIGTAVRGGIERRPSVARRIYATVAGRRRSRDGFRKGWTPQQVHHGCTSGLRNRVEGRVDAVWRLVPSLVPFLKSSTPRATTAHQRGEMLVGVGQDDAFDLRLTRRECLVNHR
jgi:hypothetical protein